MISSFRRQIRSLLGDKIWGEDLGANLEGKDIPQQAIAITKGLTELFLDFTGICYASATVYMLKEYDTRISATENDIYIEKLAYLGENAPMVAFNLVGEFLEDSAKFFVNQDAKFNANNQKANIIEAVSEAIRIFVNLYYVLKYTLDFLDYVTTNFDGTLPDILFSVGYIAFIVATVQNLISNFWGLGLNYYDYSTGEYTGGDTPTLLLGNTRYWDFLEILLPLITGFTGIIGSHFADLW